MYAPQATVNIIDDYQVVNKMALSLPELLEDVVPCPNSNCISHNEPVQSSFRVKKLASDVVLTCKYCEKEFERHAVIR